MLPGCHLWTFQQCQNMSLLSSTCPFSYSPKLYVYSMHFTAVLYPIHPICLNEHLNILYVLKWSALAPSTHPVAQSHRLLSTNLIGDIQTFFLFCFVIFLMSSSSSLHLIAQVSPLDENIFAQGKTFE